MFKCKKNNSILISLCLIFNLNNSIQAFSPALKNNVIVSTFKIKNLEARNRSIGFATREDEINEQAAETKKQSLEEKMASWEASDEEIKAASLGGLTPGKKSTDGFDVGLLLAFPLIVGTSLLFAVFPFIMDKIDVSSVGPPPTV